MKKCQQLLCHMHVGSLARHEHRTQHNTPSLVLEQLLKHLDFFHLHEPGCWMFGLAGIVINNGHNVPLIRTRPNSVAGGRAGLLRCSVLYKALSKCRLKASSVGGSILRSDFEEANMCCRRVFRLQSWPLFP